MVLLQQTEKTGGTGGWTSVGSKGSSWPQSSVVTAKNIAANEWSNSWTPTTTVPAPEKTKTIVEPAVPQSSDSLSPKKEESVAPSALSWVQKDSVPNPWLPQVASTTAAPALKKVVPPKEVKPTIEEELSKQSLYKTELCRSFSETGSCRYGHKCQFAHGEHELRAILRHPKYKTEYCKRFATTGNCPYGSRCRFIHPGANGHWSTSWNDDQPEQDDQPAPIQKQPQVEQDDEDDSDETPRRLAIFQNLTERTFF